MANTKVQRSVFWLATLVAGILMGTMLVGTAGADPAGPPGGLEVAEQNLDGLGHIQVHEQGVADVKVTNASLDVEVEFPANQNVNVTNSTPLPVSGNVTADVSGSSVSLSSPVDINGPVAVTGTVAVTGVSKAPLPVTGTVAVTGVSKAPLPVTGTVEVTGGEEGFRLTNDLFVVGPMNVSAGSDILHPLFGPVTAVSLHSDRRAFLQFQKDSGLVHTIFLEPGDSVNLTFPHPLDADFVKVACSSGTCTIRLAISGYVESP